MSNYKLSYPDTLKKLYTQLPMYQRQGSVAFKKDLTNIIKLCSALDDPHQKFPTIHIAGTNGKGSSAHMLSAILQSHGFKTGLYTSPHYRDFRERIKIDGKYVNKQFVIDFVAENETLFEKIKPSFFEITVAMAFQYFANKKVDVAVIETGLGGRLDSTNVITPLISLITNISLDHQSMLGNDLPSIAGEKAGIIKENVPVVISQTQAEVSAVFKKKAKAMEASISFADALFRSTLKQTKNGQSIVDVYQMKKLLYEDLKLDLAGTYQLKNLNGVLDTIHQLDKIWSPFKLNESKLRSALINLRQLTRFMGRWQLLEESPRTLADSAHNVDGIRLAMEQVDEISFDQLHFVIGVVNDKDLSNILSLLPKTAKYYFAKADIPRGLDAKKLKQVGSEFDLKGRAYSSVKNALKAAKRAANANDLIYVGGSCFVVAEVI